MIDRYIVQHGSIKEEFGNYEAASLRQEELHALGRPSQLYREVHVLQRYDLCWRSGKS